MSRRRLKGWFGTPRSVCYRPLGTGGSSPGGSVISIWSCGCSATCAIQARFRSTSARPSAVTPSICSITPANAMHSDRGRTPRPDAAAYLVDRLAAGSHPRLRVETVALSDHTGYAQLRVLVGDTGRSSIEQANPVERLGAVKELCVPTQRLDDYDGLEPVGCN